jgi:hypothetical protein
MNLRFTAADAERASDEWGCNCGPSALAAITGRSLDEIRQIMGDFERKRYTNPTLMFDSLNRAGVKWWKLEGIPTFGLLRIQWEGPWTEPGVPMRVRYRHTHWVAIQQHERMGIQYPGKISPDAGIFDINAMASGGWIAFRDWAATLVPWIIQECVPRANGRWHITHQVQIELPLKRQENRHE